MLTEIIEQLDPEVSLSEWADVDARALEMDMLSDETLETLRERVESECLRRGIPDAIDAAGIKLRRATGQDTSAIGVTRVNVSSFDRSTSQDLWKTSSGDFVGAGDTLDEAVAKCIGAARGRRVA